MAPLPGWNGLQLLSETDLEMSMNMSLQILSSFSLFFILSWSLRFFSSHSSLHLTGEFNGWNRTSHPFTGKSFGRLVWQQEKPYPSRISYHPLIREDWINETSKLDLNCIAFHESLLEWMRFVWTWSLETRRDIIQRVKSGETLQINVISGGVSHCLDRKENPQSHTLERSVNKFSNHFIYISPKPQISLCFFKLQVKILVNGEERISPWASYVLQPPRENQVQPFCVWESILTSWRDLKAPPLLNTCGHQQKMWSTSFCTLDPPNRQVSGAFFGGSQTKCSWFLLYYDLSTFVRIHFSERCTNAKQMMRGALKCICLVLLNELKIRFCNIVCTI